jgi:Tfp pilus assembly protein PilF
MRVSGTRNKGQKRNVRPSFQSGTDKERASTIVICLLLVAIVWIVFGQTLGHEFINYDDHDYVYENPRITSGLSLEGIVWAFTHVHSNNWHPLTTISHMLDCSLFGLQPWGHHFTNVLLHSAAAIFLFLALLELTGARWPSAFVAALFAIHPLRVESVAWVAERKDVLSGVFFMLTLWAYAYYVRRSRPSRSRYTVIVVFFALGLMCKPTLVTLPFVLLLLDYWPLRRFASQSPHSTRDRAADPWSWNTFPGGPLPTRSIQYLLMEKVPLFLLSAMSCVATLLAQHEAVMPTQQLAFVDRVANAVMSYVVYLNQLIWPVDLAVYYPYPEGGLTISQVLVASLGLLIVSAVFFIWRGKFPFLWVGWLWFLGVLTPMIGIVQVGEQAHADRYTYLSQIGLYFLATWGAMALLGLRRGGRAILITAAVVIVAILTMDSYVQAAFWRDSETLWRHTLSNTSNNYVAHNDLGDALMKKGQVDEAIVQCRKAIAIYADCSEAYANLGNAFLKKGNLADAIASYRVAIHLRPNHPSAHNNLGISLAEVGNTDEALAEFNEALRIDRDFRDAHCNLATLLLRLSRRDEAMAHLREALRLKPDDAKVRAQLSELGVQK